MNGKILTFYSYKGGTGRTMAIANIGVLLSKEPNSKTLVIDWDLEAPGLVSRTYDRMLISCGHRQRFGTQQNSVGLMPMTEDGPSDTMRVLMIAKKRAELPGP